MPDYAITRPRLRVVISCAARKRIQPPPQLQMRSVKWRGAAATAHVWTSRLDQLDVPVVAARDFYAGDHWAVANSLGPAATSVGFDLDLRVVSAGYGLIRQFDLVKPYAAAFSQGHVDSVAPRLRGRMRRNALREWWTELCRWADTRDVRSLESLARQDPEAPMLVALSAPYLDTVVEDLVRARGAMADPTLLLVVSAGSDVLDVLAGNILPADASMRRAVGGALHSLNVRLARWIVRSACAHRFEHDLVVAQLHQLAAQASSVGRRVGRRLSDSDVKVFVREHLSLHARSSRSALLRELRGQGLSCEQSRFNRLFSSVTEA